MGFEVMIVDDSLIMTKKLSVMVSELGHKVVRVCSNGEEAVRAFNTLKPGMVLMDITMPGMDGIEATRQIIQKYADARIVMVTSHGQETMVINALEAGALGYVLKPVEKDKLAAMMQRAIDQAEAKIAASG